MPHFDTNVLAEPSVFYREVSLLDVLLKSTHCVCVCVCVCVCDQWAEDPELSGEDAQNMAGEKGLRQGLCETLGPATVW